MTAVGNDYGFDEIYERQVNALGQPGDVLVAISTSGNSPNVVRAHGSGQRPGNACAGPDRQGRRRHGELITPMDVHLCVPSDRTMRIQEVHILLLHALCDGIDALLLGDTE